MLLFVCLGVIMFAGWLQYVWGRRKLRAVNKKIPGPSTLPMIGNGMNLMGLSNSEVLFYIRKIVKEHGTPSRVWIGPKLFILVDQPDDVQIVLNSPNSSYKGEVYEFLEFYKKGGGGLITINGEKWKIHRKLLNPCFIPKILESYLPIFNGCSRTMVEKISKVAGHKNLFNVEENIHCCSLDMICETTMGTYLDIQNNIDHQMLIASDRVLNITTARFYQFWLHPEFIFKRTKQYITLMKDANYIRDFAIEVLKKIKTNFSGTKTKEEETDDLKKPISFISQMLKISKDNDAFNSEEVISETITAILAGTETSATAMSNAILLLAMHPTIQEKAVQELRDVFPDQNSDITKEDLSKLVYLEMVLKEGMRLLTVSPIYVRQVTGDVTLSNGVTIPAGCQVGVLSDTLHRRKDVWGEDADEFKPERFQPDIIRHPYSYMPFSGGPRICIGYKYAYMSMKITLAFLLRRFIFNTDLTLDDLRWDISITLKLLNKHMVTAERRVW